MDKRFVSIWFPYLLTDAHCCDHPELAVCSVAIAAPEKGSMKIKGVNEAARQKGVQPGMVVADCRAIFPDLEVIPYKDDQESRLLKELAIWCIRYTPFAAMDMPDGLLLDASGCTHLWGGEEQYLQVIVQQLKHKGFSATIAITDTIGMAWAAARYYQSPAIIGSGNSTEALSQLPSAALRLEPAITEKLQKLGLSRIGSFMDMPRPSLRKRFGTAILKRLDQATGHQSECIHPVFAPVTYQERLPCPEPVCTATAIEIALRKLLSALCQHLLEDAKGLRSVVLKGYRIDGNIQAIAIGTHKPSRNSKHLFRLFEPKIASIEPALGIELFLLEAAVVEDMAISQESIWGNGMQHGDAITELLDRVGGRLGTKNIRRYLPEAHYWPENTTRLACPLLEKHTISWPDQKPRPTHLLKEPEPIEVAVPLPDYPPMLFIHYGQVHKIKKADGPERIEQEWWLQQGLHRDYYYVEDETGARYWIFRLGHYNSEEAPTWFLHGFFG